MEKIPRNLYREWIMDMEFYYSHPRIFWLICLIGLIVMILAFYDIYRGGIFGDAPVVGVLAIGIGFFAIFLILSRLAGKKN